MKFGKVKYYVDLERLVQRPESIADLVKIIKLRGQGSLRGTSMLYASDLAISDDEIIKSRCFNSKEKINLVGISDIQQIRQRNLLEAWKELGNE